MSHGARILAIARLQAHQKKYRLTWRSLAGEIGIHHDTLKNAMQRGFTTARTGLRIKRWLDKLEPVLSEIPDAKKIPPRQKKQAILRLWSKCEEHKIPHSWVAYNLGVSAGTVRRWMRLDRLPSDDIYHKIRALCATCDF